MPQYVTASGQKSVASCVSVDAGYNTEVHKAFVLVHWLVTVLVRTVLLHVK